MTLARRLLMVLLGCCVYGGCAPASTMSTSELRPGEWWGGFGRMDGDRLHWSHVMVTLRVDGAAVNGEGRYLVGPDAGQLTDRAVDISGDVRGDTVEMRLSYGGQTLPCVANYGHEHVSGTCRDKDGDLELRLVWVDTSDLSEVGRIEGIYGFDDGRRVLVSQLEGLPTMLELPSGFVRALFPKGDGTWIAGPRLLVGHPEEWRLVFSEDELAVQRNGGTPERGRRRPGARQEEFSFTSTLDGTTLNGTVTSPRRDGRFPGIVWVHGSGRSSRSEAMFFPQYFADLGFAVLAFDKRGVGESGGTYTMPDGSSFSEPFLRRRGADVASAVDALRNHPRVAGAPVGMVGISQAGWVLPIAASSTNCAFTVTMGGGATPLGQEDYFSQLTDEGLSDASLRSIDDALALVRARPSEGHDWRREFAAQRCPGLWLYGLNDRSNPSQLAIDVLEQVKAAQGKDFTVVSFPDGNHPLMQSIVGGHAESLVLSRFVPGMFTTIERWLEDRGFARR